MADLKTSAKMASIGDQRVQRKSITRIQNAPNTHPRVCGLAESMFPAARRSPMTKIQIVQANPPHDNVLWQVQINCDTMTTMCQMTNYD
jgi:hypothetical protein